MIVNGLIRGVEVYWDYKLRMDFTQFCLELNVVASAAQNKKLVSERKRVFASLSCDGGDKRDRTADLLNAIQALSQLSYTPI